MIKSAKLALDLMLSCSIIIMF